MIDSIITYNQTKKVTINNVLYDGERVDLIITLRYGDRHRNGHNTFSITGELYHAGKRSEKNMLCCGCIHDIIRTLAPVYAKYIKWHLMSSEEPLHYIANTLYFAKNKDCWGYRKGEGKEPDLEAARSAAIAPNATLKQLQNEEWLKARLPQLRQEFKEAMESLGFTY